MLHVAGMRNATNDNDPLTFRPLAIAVANVVEWLRQETGRAENDPEESQRGESKNEGGDEKQMAHRSGPMLDDDDANDGNCEAEREKDSDAGRQVVARAARLKPLACLSV